MTYLEERQQLVVEVGKGFDADHPEIENNWPEEKKRRSQRQAAVNAAVAEWERKQEPLASITVNQSDSNTEIRCERFGGSITVYRPRRTYAWDDVDNRKPKIIPGYLNASSWQAGNGRENATSADTRAELLVRLRMMEIAVDHLNRYNEVVLDWEPVENPFWEARQLKVTVEEYRRRERQAREEADRKQQAKEDRKKARA